MPPNPNPAEGPVQRIELPPLGATLVNRYVLEQQLAVGGTATVFRARDSVLEQVVAVKIIHSNNTDPTTPSGRILSDLKHEAIASMQLSHPNITRIYNYEKSEHWGFLVMEFVVGEDLRAYREHFPRKCLPPEEAMRIGERSLRGLAHAHRLGIIHHDIKPANVLITPSGEVKLCDFGLSALAALAARGELGGSVVAGTPQYISPEAITQAHVDHRSDLYSLAATLYDLMVGVPPFGRDPMTAYRGHLHESPPNSPLLPPAVAAVIFKALAKKPEDRFQTAEQMRRELLELMNMAKNKTQSVASARSASAASTGSFGGSGGGEPPPSAKPGAEGEAEDPGSEWIMLDEDMIEKAEEAADEVQPKHTPPPLPSPTSKGEPPTNEKGKENMKSLDQLMGQESWLQAVVRADASGNVAELAGKVDGETTCAAIAMCSGPLERAAGLLGLGDVTGWTLGGKKASFYVQRERTGFLVGLSAPVGNPEVMMKKFAKALPGKG